MTLNVLIQQFMLQAYADNQYVSYYAITVSPHQKNQPEAVIHASMQHLILKCKNVISVRYIIEKSEKGKYHSHGVLCSRSRSKFTKVRNHPLCQFYITPYNPGFEWTEYISKYMPDKCYTIHYNTEGKLQYPINKLDWYAFCDNTDDEGD